MAKKSAKKAAPKKTTNRKSAAKKVAKKASKKAAPKKAIAKKAAPARDDEWKVVCSVQGTIATGLSRAAAKKLSEDHQKETGHATTYTHGQ